MRPRGTGEAKSLPGANWNPKCRSPDWHGVSLRQSLARQGPSGGPIISKAASKLRGQTGPSSDGSAAAELRKAGKAQQRPEPGTAALSSPPPITHMADTGQRRPAVRLVSDSRLPSASGREGVPEALGPRTLKDARCVGGALHSIHAPTSGKF